MFRILFFYCFLSFQTICAQSIAELSTKELNEDFLFLKQVIEKHNPALFKYLNPQRYKTVWDSLQTYLEAPIGTLDFHKILARAVAETQEGHMVLGQQEDPFFSGFFNDEFKIFPFEVRLIQKRLYVWRNFSADSTLVQGDEILAINGHSVQMLMDSIYPYISADGRIQSYRQQVFADEFAANYFWFIGQPALYNISYRKLKTEQCKDIEIVALSRPQMAEWAKIKAIKKEKPLGLAQIYSLYQQEQTAVLQLRSFDEKLCQKYQIDTRQLYENIFRRLRKNKTKHLIIDVRQNKGGLKTFADELLTYCLKQHRKGIYRKLSNRQGQVLNTYFPKRNPWYFKGKLYVLTDGGTFSTAALIAQYLKNFCNATIIGNETGSRYEGFAAGTLFFCRLPNSAINIGIPNKWVQNLMPIPNFMQNRGLTPDYLIQPTIDDLLNNRDVVLQKAFELISKSY